MTVAYSDWEFRVTGTSTPQTLFAALPMFVQCPKWTGASAIGAELHKVKCRVHCRTTATLNVSVDADVDEDNPITITEPTGTTDDWNATWANADVQESYPDGQGWGIYPPDLTAKWVPVKIDMTVASGTQYINGIEFGLNTDESYTGGDAVEIPRSGADRPYLENRPGSSMLMSSAIADTLNKILYDAEFRISCPLIGR